MVLCACRVAFQIIPNIVAQPRPTVRWQYAAAAVLFGLTLLSATQLGLLANVSKLPKARPASILSDDINRHLSICMTSICMHHTARVSRHCCVILLSKLPMTTQLQSL